MPIKWNCLEPLTAIGIGIGACALAPLDMGLAAAGVIGGSGLLARIKENSRKAGLEDDKLIARMQKQLLGKLDHWDSHAERAAAERADEAMQRLLPQVMLTREQLAERIGISRYVMADIEKGKPTTAVAAYLGALWALGLLKDAERVADPDRDLEGKTLEAARSPKTAPKRKALDDDF